MVMRPAAYTSYRNKAYCIAMVMRPVTFKRKNMPTKSTTQRIEVKTGPLKVEKELREATSQYQ